MPRPFYGATRGKGTPFPVPTRALGIKNPLSSPNANAMSHESLSKSYADTETYAELFHSGQKRLAIANHADCKAEPNMLTYSLLRWTDRLNFLL